MSDHRKYHGMYFILGFIIAAMLVMLLGCEQADTSAGVIIERPPEQSCMAMTQS